MSHEALEHTLVRLDERLGGASSERILDRFGDPAKIALRSTSFYALFGAVRAGLGIGLLPFFLAAQERGLFERGRR